MCLKHDFFSRGYSKIGNGTHVRFWEGAWLGDLPLSQQYPSLYNIVQYKNILVSTIFASTPINISF
jgi:hypothetical protein